MDDKKQQIIEYLKSYSGPAVKIMEVCGTHTASIFKSGIRSILPERVSLISGPGCPVCVTASSFIDKCISYAMMDKHILVTFGDMMKVPGENESLSDAKGSGANVRIMYSPSEIIEEAKKNPAITYIIAAVGFETTAPTYAILLEELMEEKIDNIKLLVAIKTVMPALHWICGAEEGIDAFICPGHVSTIIGSTIYEELAVKYKKPFVVTGFEPEHILAAAYDILKQLEAGRAEVHNFYKNAVRPDGNLKAKNMINAYFEPGDAQWRGLGMIENSGLYLKKEYEAYDAGSKALILDAKIPAGCRCSEVIIGRIHPDECPMFAKACTPGSPYGPCMVSGEGACGIWYKNRR